MHACTWGQSLVAAANIVSQERDRGQEEETSFEQHTRDVQLLFAFNDCRFTFPFFLSLNSAPLFSHEEKFKHSILLCWFPWISRSRQMKISQNFPETSFSFIREISSRSLGSIHIPEAAFTRGCCELLAIKLSVKREIVKAKRVTLRWRVKEEKREERGGLNNR